MFECDKLTEEKSSRRYIYDVILLAAVLLVCLCIYAFIRIHKSSSAYFTISVTADSGAQEFELPLYEDGYYCVGFEDDGSFISVSELTCDTKETDALISSFAEYNLIEVKEGNVSVIRASCPDLVCVHTVSVTEDGGVIVCLPHKMTITAGSGKSGGGEPDAVTW